MKHGVMISFSSMLVVALFALPLAVRADTNPDFDDDAKPILRTQPGLLQYVESRFDVKDTGTAKYPGDDDRRPMPPYIFRARPIGSDGPYNLRLLIQPGSQGHVLGVVDITKVHLGAPANSSSQPSVANRPPPQYSQPPSQYSPPPPQNSQAAPSVQVPELSAPPQYQQQQSAPASSTQAPAQQQPQPSEPTADTPSGPIMDSNSQAPAPGQDQSSTQQPLAPPPDPAPPAQ